MSGWWAASWEELGRWLACWGRQRLQSQQALLTVREGEGWRIVFPVQKGIAGADSLSEEVARCGQVRLLSRADASAFPYAEGGSCPTEMGQGVQAWGALPLSDGLRVQAVLHLLWQGEGLPAVGDLEQAKEELRGVAWVVRALGAEEALQRAQEREARRRLELAALQEISLAMRSLSDPETTLGEVVSRLGLILDAEKCFILLVDPQRRLLLPQPPVLGLTDQEIEAIQLPLDHPLARTLFQQGHPLRGVHPFEAELSCALQSWGSASQVRSLLLAPLLADQQPWGVVCVLNRRGGEGFTEADEALLSMLASHAASILHNARLHTSLQEEQSKLRAVLDSLVDPAIVLDREDRIVLLNQQAEVLLGLREEDVRGLPLPDAIHREEVVRLVLDPPEQEPGQPPPEVIFEGEGYPRVFQVRMSEVRGEEGTVLGRVVVLNDITALRRVDQMKSEFVSTVSHELRTPLTSIKAFTSTLLRRDVSFDAETQREWLTIINTQTDRLTRLINDLLSISRIERGLALQMHYSELALDRVVQDVIETQQAYSTRHRLSMQVESGIGMVEADEDKLIQILTNLVNNAIKYSPQGGEVRVTVRDQGDQVCVSVSDQGPGIPPEHLKRVFDKFHQVDSSSTRRVGGTGLGLYLTKHLVEAHHGRIWVESELGRGATFFFVLPKHPPPT